MTDAHFEPSASDARASRGELACRVGLVIILAGQLALLLGTAGRHRHRINPDGVAYLELARHYAEGDLALAVSPYWGPMLSWLIAPLLQLGVQPLLASRAAMLASAVVFALGSASLFRAAGLRAPWVLLGTALVALASVRWSLAITPDLLMAGLLMGSVGLMLRVRANEASGLPLRAGLLAGAAFLAKPVALPIALATAAALLIGRRFCGEGALAPTMKAFAWLASGVLFVAGPWILILSMDQGHLTLGTSGAINHALMAATRSEPVHPVFGIYHLPEPGRVTQWEDPSAMPYDYWSPFDSADHMRHQLLLLRDNAAHAAERVLGIDRLGAGLLGLLAAFSFHRPWRSAMLEDRWRWCLVPALLAAAAYLPLYASSLRYYYPVYPLMIAASLGLVGSLLRSEGVRRGVGALGLVLILGSLTPPLRDLSPRWTPVALGSLPVARAAARLARADALGPIAGVGGPAGLYLAFFGRVPFLGSEAEPSPGRVIASGASLVVAPPGSAMSTALERDRRFRSLDSVAFARSDAVGGRPFHVYRVRLAAE